MATSQTNGRPTHPLRKARQAKGLRLADVAVKADCSIGLVSMVESGYVPPVPRQEAIAAAVGASSGSFWP